MHVHIRGRFQPLHRARPDGRPARPGRRRPLGGTVVALGLVAMACSGSSDAASSEPEPTFARVEGGALQLPEPVASVSELLPPSGDEEPWTVLGSVFDPDSGTSTAASWRSDDGRAWEREDLAPTRGDVSESFEAAADSELGRFAVGSVGDGPESQAAVWHQDDDGGWSEPVGPEPGGEHGQWAFDVAASASGVLVAGGESVWGEVRPRVWFSEDGESWASVDGGPGGPFDATGQESIRAVAPFGEGFVAVGTRTLDNEQDGVAWYSPDGRDWEQVEAPTLAGDGRQALLSVAPAGDGLVAGGITTDGNGQGRPVAWRSRDGQSWGQPSLLPLHDDQRSGTADMMVASLSGGEGGVVAAGGSDWRPHMWRTTDGGASWDLLPNPVGRGLFEDGVALAGAARHGDITLALGREPTVMRLSGDRWQDATGDQFPKGGEQPFGAALAVGEEATILAGGRSRAPAGDQRERHVGQVWTEDGGWSVVETDHLDAGRITDITPYAGGFIAVGLEDRGLAKQRTAGDNSAPDGLIWVSSDGQEWNRVGANIATIDQDLIPILAENDHDDLPGVIAQTAASQPFETSPPAGGAGSQALEAVAPLGDGFIAVGVTYHEAEAEPIVVTSGDGSQLRGEEHGFGGAGTQSFRDVCVSPDGVAVAVGITDADGTYNVGVRRRDDVDAWRRGESSDDSFGGPGDQQAYGCAAGDEGFVMVGSDDGNGDADARIWTSEDGVTWTRVESGTLGGAGDQWARAVAAVPEDEGGGWLVGGTDTAAGDDDVALWRLHPDGELSRRDQGEPALGGPGSQSVGDIAIEGSRVVIIGDDHRGVGVWESDRIDR